MAFAELALYGGDRPEIAVGFAAIQALSLSVLLLLSREAAGALTSVRFQRLAGIFGALALWILVQLTPFASGMARDGWSAVGGPPSITLDRFATLVEWVKLLGLGAVFTLGVIVGRSGRTARLAFDGFGVLGAFYAAWAIADFYAGGRLGGAGPSDGRLMASLLSPNLAAACLGVFAIHGWVGGIRNGRASADPSKVVVFGRVRMSRAALPWAGLMTLSLWAVTLTASRGGLLSVLLGFGAVALMSLLRGRRTGGRHGSRTAKLPAALVGLLGTVLLLSSVGLIGARLRATSSGLTDRAVHLQVYFSELSHLPWTGLGMGTFRRFNTIIASASEAPRFWELGAMHNVYLQWGYEGGAPGAVLMFACVGLILWTVLTAPGSGRPGSAWIETAAGASILFLSHGLIDFDLQLVGLAVLWSLVLGAGFGAAERVASSRD